MFSVSLKCRLGVIRRRTKGTVCTCVWQLPVCVPAVCGRASAAVWSYLWCVSSLTHSFASSLALWMWRCGTWISFSVCSSPCSWKPFVFLRMFVNLVNLHVSISVKNITFHSCYCLAFPSFPSSSSTSFPNFTFQAPLCFFLTCSFKRWKSAGNHRILNQLPAQSGTMSSTCADVLCWCLDKETTSLLHWVV